MKVMMTLTILTPTQNFSFSVVDQADWTNFRSDNLGGVFYVYVHAYVHAYVHIGHLERD